MHRLGSPLRVALISVALAGLAGCDRTGIPTAGASNAGDGTDAAFAALQARGQQAMGVDQYTSTHVFDALPDGGRIELQRDVDDREGIAQIRQHLQGIAIAFATGDFSTPMFVHPEAVPGTAVMAAKRDAITYTYSELPRGGELRIATRDAEALQAIREFMSFQRQEHHVDGMVGGHHDGMPHGPDHVPPSNHDGADHAMPPNHGGTGHVRPPHHGGPEPE